MKRARNVLSILALATGALRCGFDSLPGPSSTPGADGGSPLDDGANPVDAQLVDANGSDAPVVTTTDRRWARWKLPPDDVSAVSYDLQTDIVIDPVTKLTWQRVSTAKSPYLDAAAYCGSLTLAGFDDWWVPTRIEAISIMDIHPGNASSTESTSYRRDIFSGTPGNATWTASTSAAPSVSTGKERFVVMYDGGIMLLPTESLNIDIRCVRGEALVTTPQAPTFETVSGVVHDPATGLYWEQIGLTGTYSPTAAKTLCSGVSRGQFSTGWRLPTIKELSSIVDETRTKPAIHTAFNTADVDLQTSNLALAPNYFYIIKHEYGEWSNLGQVGGNVAGVRCVHD